MSSPLLFVAPPAYFPAPEFLGGALQARTVVLADTYQYVRQSDHNRAAVRTPDGTQWLSIPIASGQLGHSIARTRIAERARWPGKHLKALRFNYGKSPFYEHLVPEVRALLTSAGESLGGITVASTRLLLRWLRFEGAVVAASELPEAPSTLEGIAAAWPDHEVLVLPPSQHPAAAWVAQVTPIRYRQAFDGFEPGLSGLDLIMNLGPAARVSLEPSAQPIPA